MKEETPMKKTNYECVLAVCVAICTIPCFGQPTPNEVQIGPIPVTQSISGVPVTIAVTSYMNITTDPDGLAIGTRLIGNLGDLQARIGTIVDTLPLPTNNCQSFSANNPVVRVWGKQLVLSGS